jgi:hypothetical protein
LAVAITLVTGVDYVLQAARLGRPPVPPPAGTRSGPQGGS